MPDLTRREFLKSIGVVATAVSIPITLEIITKPFIQTAHKNFLVLQASQKLVVAEVKAVDFGLAQREKVLPIVFADSFDIRELQGFLQLPSRLSLELFNGVPMKFEGAGTIYLVYKSKDGNCIDVFLDEFRCLTGI